MRDLRELYSTFEYTNYEIINHSDKLEVKYTYRISDYVFSPVVTINKENITNNNVDKDFLEYLFFNFGIINAINYYKLTCSKKFSIKCGYLNDEQKKFFKKLFYNGLSELLYKNNLNITYEDFFDIDVINKKLNFEIQDTFNGNLIPIGGGKDSIVTLEILKDEKNKNKCFVYKRNIYPDDKAILNTIHTAGYDDNDILYFNVTLDPLMLKLNKEGFYNGHVPLSSCLAFASYIMAYLNNKKYIVLSNEASANEGNVNGTNINHQYSKSYEFEKDFREYTSNYFTKYIEYFSLLRCWNEFQIVKRFLQQPKYLDVFRSCNIGMKKNEWCGNCSKCLYVYIMLYPFVNKDKLIEIFHSDMLDNIQYKDIFLGLINQDVDKPFECVGTRDEINYALGLAIQNNDNLPVLLRYYKDNYYNKDIKYNIENYYNSENFINKKFLRMIGYDQCEK